MAPGADHGAVGRKLLDNHYTNKPYIDTYAKVIESVRPNWYDLLYYRGRRKKPEHDLVEKSALIKKIGVELGL